MGADWGLMVAGTNGDFLVIKPYQKAVKKTESEDFWENRRRVKELAEMDNCSMVGWDLHESY